MDTDLDVADESPVQVPLVPESAINFTLNAVATPSSSSTEEISRGPATPAPAGQSGGTTSGLVSAPGSAVPLCAPNQGAQGPGQPSSAPFAPSAPLAPGFPAPIPPRAHHGSAHSEHFGSVS